MWKEFKEFALKGNMMDLAVGMIIGAAFTSIVKSLVDKIIMPALSLITGKLDFENMFVALNGQTDKTYAAASENGAVLGYGSFITEVINFLIMAFVVFLIVKGINTMRKKLEKPAEEAPAEEKECPYCKSMIPITATKCAHCTSVVE